jgi:hypothetical protein
MELLLKIISSEESAEGSGIIQVNKWFIFARNFWSANESRSGCVVQS